MMRHSPGGSAGLTRLQIAVDDVLLVGRGQGRGGLTRPPLGDSSTEAVRSGSPLQHRVHDLDVLRHPDLFVPALGDETIEGFALSRASR